jgi:hypothetical protein
MRHKHLCKLCAESRMIDLEYFEARWANDRVLCFANTEKTGIIGIWSNIKSDTPLGCPYRLEQVVNNQGHPDLVGSGVSVYGGNGHE